MDIAEFYPSISEEILDNAILFAQQHINISEKDLCIINIVGNLYYTIIMNLGRKKIEKAVSTSPWAVFMVPKFASLSASIYYLYYQINVINNLVACTGMMDWYF